MADPENIIAEFIANRVGRDYEHIDVMLACSLLDKLKEEGWVLVERVPVVEVEVTPSQFRAAHEDAGVTRTSSSDLVAATERHPAARRSGAKNVSDPRYQEAFISEARSAMGQPSVEDAKTHLNRLVRLTFNVDWWPAIGQLTDVVTNTLTEGVLKQPYLILDNYRERIYPLNAVQKIEELVS